MTFDRDFTQFLKYESDVGGDDDDDDDDFRTPVRLELQLHV